MEITPEMVEAGAEALAGRYFDLVDSYEYPEIARTVFEAMLAKETRQLTDKMIKAGVAAYQCPVLHR